MPALKQNLKCNRPSLHSKALKTAQLQWSNPAQIKALKPLFNVVTTGIVNVKQLVALLLAAIGAMVTNNGVVLLRFRMGFARGGLVFLGVVNFIFSFKFFG